MADGAAGKKRYVMSEFRASHIVFLLHYLHVRGIKSADAEDSEEAMKKSLSASMQQSPSPLPVSYHPARQPAGHVLNSTPAHSVNTDPATFAKLEPYFVVKVSHVF